MRNLVASERVELLSYLHRTPLALEPRYLGALLAIAQGHRSEFAADMVPRSTGQAAPVGSGVAVIPVLGAITHRSDAMSQWLGWASVEDIRTNFRAALADPNVGSILFDIDSPGGEVAGIADLATEIRAARGQKPMVAIANESMFSAAYWLGSAADRVVLTQTAGVGSIGVIAVHVDESQALAAQGRVVTVVKSGARKAQFNALEPLTDQARADLESEVAHLAGVFAKQVATAREALTVDAIQALEGGTLTGKAAVAAGLADAVTTMSDELRRLARGAARGTTQSTRALAAQEEHPMSDAVTITTTTGTFAAGGLPEETILVTAPDPKVVALEHAATARATAAERARVGTITRLFAAMQAGATAAERKQLTAQADQLVADGATLAQATDALVTLRASFQSSEEITATGPAGQSDRRDQPVAPTPRSRESMIASQNATLAAAQASARL